MLLIPNLALDFIDGPADVIHAYDTHFDGIVVTASLLIAVFAAFCALEMSNHVGARRRWIGFGAVMLGAGVWAMHFLGMVAFRLDCGVSYDPWQTGLSVIPGVFAAAVALHVASRDRVGLGTLAFAGTVMGAGVGLMHYMGMAAIRLDGVLRYDPRRFLLSIAAAVLLSIGALWLRSFIARMRIGRHPYVSSALGGLVMGLAISSMHYIAMSAAYFIPSGSQGHVGLTSPVMLATAVGLATLALLLCGFVFMAVSARMLMARKRNEAMLLMLQNVSAVIDNMGDGLLVTDAAGHVTQANRALLALFGSPAEVIGEECAAAFGQEVGRFVAEALAQPDLNASLSSEVALPEKRVAKVVATLLHGEQGRTPSPLDGAVVTFRDITREVEVSRMKTDFIANVSHELRTPLTSVLGFAKVIRKQFQRTLVPALDTSNSKIASTVEKIQSQLDIIVSEGERLTNLINDVLDLTKMEAGKIEWRTEPVDIKALLERAVAATSAVYLQKGIAAVLNVAEGMPHIIGDPDRLLQVMINLLSNAAKFTEQGNVLVSAVRDGDRIAIAVTDSGCGISPQDQKLLFERFRQVGDTLTDKPSGTGLGLAICKQFVEHHGGTIRVESALGLGSTFSFSLPLPASDLMTDSAPSPEPMAEAASAERSRSGRKVLVVDDDANIRALLRLELESAGYCVRDVEDGLQAIRAAKKERPDLILLDVMMPGMNGFEVAAVLRAGPETRAIPIIILSIVEDRARGRAVGADRYLSKPIEMDVLLAEIDGLLRKKESTKRVLLVDEEDSTVESMRDVLLAKGYQAEIIEQSVADLRRIQAALPELLVVSASPEESPRVVSSMQMARDGERALLVVMGSGRKER